LSPPQRLQLTQTQKYASFAAALTDILVKHKYKAEHIKKINAVKITDNGRDYFAEHIPEIDFLLENIVGSAEKNNIRLLVDRGPFYNTL
jgi:hypothetical protein